MGNCTCSDSKKSKKELLLTSQIKQKKQHIANSDENKNENGKNKSIHDSLICGLKSTMNDSFPLTLKSLLHRGSIVQPHSEIITALKNGETHRISIKQLKYESDKMSLALNAFGVVPGDIIASFMWSNAKHAILYQTIPLMGAVLHTINIRLHPNELSYLIEHANDKIIFIDSDLLPIISKISKNALKNVELFVICKEIGNDDLKFDESNIPNLPSKKCMYFEQFVEKYSNMDNGNYTYPDLTEDSGAVLCYTSGTTGNPKGILYSHRSIYLEVLQMCGIDNLAISGSDCVLAIVPMFHVMGWLQPFICMTLGNKSLLMGNTKDFTFILDLCLAEKCTLILGVPTVMNIFRNTLSNNPDKYKPLKGILKRAVCGGSAPSHDLIKWFWNNWEIKLCQIWGMTECMLGSVGQPMQRRVDVNKSMKQQILDNSTVCGLPISSLEYKIVDVENINNELEHDGKQIGDLLVFGPTCTREYFRINSNNFDQNGYLNTGDICSINPTEIIVLKDRSKDVIKSGGEWISSIDMGNCIMALDEIDKACVVAVKSEKYDERPIAIVQLFDNKQCEPKKILNHLKSKYANFQLPDDILYWKIPLTGTGKMSKQKVRDQLKTENYVLRNPPLRKVLNLTK